MNDIKLSILIPVFNSDSTIERLVNTLFDELDAYEFEIVLVNDGSVDKSHDICVRLAQKNKSITYLQLAKNFGEHNAVMAGLNNVSGDYTVIIDDDFQNPPAAVNVLVKEMISGDYDVVYSYYSKKKDSLFRNLGSQFNNIIATFLLKKTCNLYMSSFKCLNKFIVSEIIKYAGPFPYIDGLIFRCTNNIGSVEVEHSKREDRASNYTFRKLVRLWINMFVNFSIFPLRVSMIVGSIFFFMGLLTSIYIIVEKILYPGIPVGITSILIGILTFGGFQMMVLGLMGEYLGKLFLMENVTPQYVIRRKFFFLKKNKGEKIDENIFYR
jgi:polyisoprenyl-phosphate glycosyltransferase